VVDDGARLDHREKIGGNASWNGRPTCMPLGISVQQLVMRGICMGPDEMAERVPYDLAVLDKVRAAHGWKSGMAQRAFEQTVLTGTPFVSRRERAGSLLAVLMCKAKLAVS
jgi:hypothetical protein